MALFTRRQPFTRILSAAIAGWFLALQSAGALAAEVQTGVPTNFEIVERVSEKAAGDVVSALGGIPQGSLVKLLKAKGAADADFLLENAFVERMREIGIRVTLGAQQKEGAMSEASDFTLSYQVIRLSLRYPRISRRFWFGSKEVERDARADVVAQLIDSRSGDILWIREGHDRYQDTIPYSLLPSVEEKQYEFTRPPRNEFKMSRLIEPVVVGGIVAGLVYLFFSNQSE